MRINTVVIYGDLISECSRLVENYGLDIDLLNGTGIIDASGYFDCRHRILYHEMEVDLSHPPKQIWYRKLREIRIYYRIIIFAKFVTCYI